MRVKTTKKSLVVIFVLLCIGYGLYHSRVVISSDTTATLPMARDILNGNIFLSDWVQGTNNFYFTEIVVYALGMILGIPDSILIAWIPALFYALLIVGTLYVWGEVCPDETNEVFSSFTFMVLCIVAVVPYSAAYTLLNANSHNNLYAFLVLYCAILFVYLDKEKKRYLAILTILAVLMSFSEGVTSMVLFAPVGLFCCSSLMLQKSGRKKYVMLLISICISYLFSKIMLTGIEYMGGLVTKGLPVHLLTPPQIYARIGEWFYQLGVLLGINGLELHSGKITQRIYNYVVIFIIMCWLLSLIYNTIFFKKMSQKERLLYFVTLVNVGACMVTDVVVFHRYIVPGYYFGLVLTFLTICKLIHKLNLQLLKRGVLICIVTLCLFSVFIRVHTILDVKQINGEEQKEVVKLIQENDYGEGYGDFWCASQISYFSNFDISIYPVTLWEKNNLQAYPELVKKSWYEEDNKHFVITFKDNSSRFINTGEPIVEQTFGKPSKSFSTNQYIVYYWEEDISKYLKKDFLAAGG